MKPHRFLPTVILASALLLPAAAQRMQEIQTSTKKVSPEVANEQWQRYMLEVQLGIRKHWSPPKGSEDKAVGVVFKLHADGHVSDLRVEKSSMVPAADQAAEKAIQEAAPFGKTPEGGAAVQEIHFNFDNPSPGKQSSAQSSQSTTSSSSATASSTNANSTKSGNSNASLVAAWLRQTAAHPTASNFMQLARAYEYNGDKANAAEAYKKALSIDPGLKQAKARLDAIQRAK